MSQSFLNEHGGNIYSVIRNFGNDAGTLLDYSANINPLGLSESIRCSIMQSIDQVVHYPDAEATALKIAISEAYSTALETITPGNGAVEMLYLICHVLRPKQVLVTAPAFSEYERAARAADARVVYCTLPADRGFCIQVDQIIDCLPGNDVIFLGNPNNPTGTLLEQRDIEKLLTAAAQCNTFVVVDESFLDFLPDDTAFTSRPLLSKFENLVIVHSLTKFYAIPGLRLGFALASAPLTVRMHQCKDPWNVNTFAQNAGVVALQDCRYQTAARSLIAQEKVKMYRTLGAIPGIKPFPPAANFILADITNTGFSAAQFREALFKKGILIRDCSRYPGLQGEFIRLAVKLPQQNQILFEAIQSILGASL